MAPKAVKVNKAPKAHQRSVLDYMLVPKQDTARVSTYTQALQTPRRGWEGFVRENACVIAQVGRVLDAHATWKPARTRLVPSPQQLHARLYTEPPGNVHAVLFAARKLRAGVPVLSNPVKCKLQRHLRKKENTVVELERIRGLLWVELPLVWGETAQGTRTELFPTAPFVRAIAAHFLKHHRSVPWFTMTADDSNCLQMDVNLSRRIPQLLCERGADTDPAHVDTFMDLQKRPQLHWARALQ